MPNLSNFPDLKAEKLLLFAYSLRQEGRNADEISQDLRKVYSTLELADALAVIATQFNWKRP